MTRENLIDDFEAAKRMGISQRTLVKWRCVGHPHIPYCKIGRLVKYDPRDVDAYIEKHRVGPSGE